MHLFRTGEDRFLIFYRELDGRLAVADTRTLDRSEAEVRMRELEKFLARAAAVAPKSSRTPEGRARLVLLRLNKDRRRAGWFREPKGPAARTHRPSTEREPK
jgi:hypothetical protein